MIDKFSEILENIAALLYLKASQFFCKHAFFPFDEKSEKLFCFYCDKTINKKDKKKCVL